MLHAGGLFCGPRLFAYIVGRDHDIPKNATFCDGWHTSHGQELPCDIMYGMPCNYCCPPVFGGGGGLSRKKGKRKRKRKENGEDTNGGGAGNVNDRSSGEEGDKRDGEE